MARLYANENFPRRVVEGLRSLGHDILTTFEAGNANQSISDEEVLMFAINHERAILTLNRRHFMRLHLQNPSHFGIIVCTQDENIQRQIERIHEALAANPIFHNKLLRVNRA